MRIIREPLLHFAIIGALLFGGYALVKRGEPGAAALQPIYISDGEVRWLRETFASQWRRLPTSEELSGLVGSLVEEELLAREARALALDQGDTIVRRRLAQKLAFLVEDTPSMVEPAEEDLQRFYAADIDRFQRGQPRVAFTQIYFNPGRRQDADADARSALISMAASPSHGGPPPAGDPLLIDAEFDHIDQQSLSNLYGAEFALAVFKLTPGEWRGPIKSGFGLHLVRVTKVSTPEPRPFEALRDTVMEEWRRQRKREIRTSLIARLREKYGVVIDKSVTSLLVPEAIGAAAR